MRFLLVFVCCWGSAAPAAEKRVVAVLYFDNNTPQRDYDVLQKGLADMLITDLAGVEGLQIVEREKLQTLVDELKLQQTKFFDPKTAQKFGKGIGAQFAITGSLTAFDPELRIDVRLIEVATAKVVMADSVVGHKAKFFELEQQLVQKFIGGLNVKLALAPTGGAKDVAALLDYSKGVDAADKGDLQGASKRLADLVKASPDFALAKARYVDVLKRLREAGKKRTALLSVEEQALSDKIEQVLAETAGDPKQKSRRMAYRELRGHFLIVRLRKLIGPPNAPSKNPRVIVIRKADQAEAAALMRAFVENGELFIAEFGKPLTHGVDADHDDRASISRLGLEPYHTLQYDPWRAVGGFIFTGSQWDRSGLDRMRPTLAELDPAALKKGLAIYEAGEKVAHDAREAVMLLDEHAEALVAIHRKEEAVVRWQQILDQYPKDPRFAEIEGKIEDVLGISKRQQDLEAAARLCDTVTTSSWSLALRRLIQLEGEAVLARGEALVKECPGKPNATWVPRAVFQSIASDALDLGECALFLKARDRAAAINEESRTYLDSIGQACAAPP